MSGRIIELARQQPAATAAVTIAAVGISAEAETRFPNAFTVFWIDTFAAERYATRRTGNHI